MTRSNSHPTPERTIVRLGFRLAGVTLWSTLGVLALFKGLAMTGVWPLPSLPPLASTSEVRKVWGPPTQVETDTTVIRSVLTAHKGCSVPATEIWLYHRKFHEDSVVVIGAHGRVTCVEEAQGSDFRVRF